MVNEGELLCPRCGGKLKHYDRVDRIVRTKERQTRRIPMNRARCSKCGSIHRERPRTIFPYKQYESEVITGVLDGLITSDTLGYEDYPCEMTMLRWLSQKSQLLLWR